MCHEEHIYRGYAEDVPVKNVKILTHASAMVFSEGAPNSVFQANATLRTIYLYIEKRCFDYTRWNVVECR